VLVPELLFLCGVRRGISFHACPRTRRTSLDVRGDHLDAWRIFEEARLGIDTVWARHPRLRRHWALGRV